MTNPATTPPRADGAAPDPLRQLLADKRRATEFIARSMQNCCDECAVDPDGAAMRDATDVWSALCNVAQL